MNLVAIGGDKRFAHLVRAARKLGISASAFGLEKCGLYDVPSVDIDEIGSADRIIMPNPHTGEMVLPFSSKQPSLDDVLSRVSRTASVMLFGPGEVPEKILDKNAVVRLDDDEILMNELARQTAEGAIHAACERAAYELYGSRALIVGYGRVGKALHRILTGYQATVAVVARKKTALCEAAENGALALDFSNFDKALALAQMVFSTPPQRVIDAELINSVSRNTLLIDLSSAPYGVDMAAANARWLHAWREPALPGRYCPQSAGQSLLNAVLRAANGESESL